MSQTHYYYALNRKGAERALDLTWNQFLDKFGWPAWGEWDTLGKFLAYSVDRPLLPEEPTPRQVGTPSLVDAAQDHRVLIAAVLRFALPEQPVDQALAFRDS